MGSRPACLSVRALPPASAALRCPQLTHPALTLAPQLASEKGELENKLYDLKKQVRGAPGLPVQGKGEQDAHASPQSI